MLLSKYKREPEAWNKHAVLHLESEAASFSADTAHLFKLIPWLLELDSSTWGNKWQPTPVVLPGKSHGWRSLAGYSPWDCKESDTTEWPHFFLSALFINYNYRKENLTVLHEVELYYDLIILYSVLFLTIYGDLLTFFAWSIQQGNSFVNYK